MSDRQDSRLLLHTQDTISSDHRQLVVIVMKFPEGSTVEKGILAPQEMELVWVQALVCCHPASALLFW